MKRYERSVSFGIRTNHNWWLGIISALHVMMQTPHYLHKDSQLPEQLSFIRWRSGTRGTSASLAWAETSLNNDMFFSHILTLPSVLPWCFYTTVFQHYRQGAGWVILLMQSGSASITNLTKMSVGQVLVYGAPPYTHKAQASLSS